MITIRFAHLKAKSPLPVGSTVKADDIIGIIGASGDSTKEIHCHTDAVIGEVEDCFYTSQIRRGEYTTINDRILSMFSDDLIREPLRVSHYPHEYEYYHRVGYHHEGFDFIPVAYPPKYDVFIRVPEFLDGCKVIANYFDKPGYGNAVHFLKEAK